jgi:hypothetical protein
MYDVIVTPCSGNATSLEWCCGNSNDCCFEGSNLPKFTIAMKFGDPIPTPLATSSSSSPVSSSSSSSSSSVSTAASTSPTANQPSDTSGLSTGAKAGIGIGVAVVALTCVVLGILIRKSKQRKKTSSARNWTERKVKCTSCRVDTALSCRVVTILPKSASRYRLQDREVIEWLIAQRSAWSC